MSPERGSVASQASPCNSAAAALIGSLDREVLLGDGETQWTPGVGALFPEFLRLAR